MAILGHYAELEDWKTAVGNWIYYSGGGGRFRYGRAALYLGTGNAGAFLQDDWEAGAVTTVCMSTRNYTSSDAFAAASVGRFMGLTDGGSLRLALKGTFATGLIKLVTVDGASEVVLATSAYAPSAYTLQRFDLFVEGYNSASARVRVWHQEGTAAQNLMLDYTGDVRVGGSTSLDGLWRTGHSATNPSDLHCFSETFVADVATTRMGLRTFYPNAAGDVNDFDTGAYTDVDEITADTSNFCESGTAGQRFLFGQTDFAGGITERVLSVQVTALAARGDTGPANMNLGIKSGTTEDWGPDIPLDVAYAGHRRLMAVDPTDSAPWDQDKVNALQAGAKSVT